MLRLLPFPIFICIYLFSWWSCKKNIIASDKQLKPCIDWAYIKNLPLLPKPSFVEFYIVYVSSFFKFPFGIIIQQLPFAKKVRYYEREMKLIFDSAEADKRHSEFDIKPLFRGVSKKDPQKVIVIHQAPEGNVQKFVEANGDWMATHRVDLSTMEESSWTVSLLSLIHI